MKKLLLLLFLIFSIGVAMGQQCSTKVSRDSQGNFYETKTCKTAVLTKYKYMDAQRKVYPVYMNGKGKFFIYRVSKKTGKPYIFPIKV